MPLRILFGGIPLTFQNGQWLPLSPHDAVFASAWETFLRSTSDPLGSDPYPLLTRVKEAQRRLSDSVSITDEGEPPAFDPNVLY